MNTDVLIVGAGPTGLTLAIDLGKRGIHCTIIEQKEAPAFLPKMERAKSDDNGSHADSNNTHLTAKNVTMEALARRLSRNRDIGKPVVDKTG